MVHCDTLKAKRNASQMIYIILTPDHEQNQEGGKEAGKEEPPKAARSSSPTARRKPCSSSRSRGEAGGVVENDPLRSLLTSLPRLPPPSGAWIPRPVLGSPASLAQQLPPRAPRPGHSPPRPTAPWIGVSPTSARGTPGIGAPQRPLTFLVCHRYLMLLD